MNYFTNRDKILFFGLLLAGLLGCASGVPFSIAVLNDPVAGGPVNPQTIWLRAALEALILLAPALVVGLWLGKKVDLGMVLPMSLYKKDSRFIERLRLLVLPAVPVGLVLALPGLISLTFIQRGDW